MQLRPYQTAAVDAVFDALTEVNSTLLAACVGAGKSLLQGEIFKRTLELNPAARCLSLAHTEELIKQNYAALIRVWPGAPAGINSAAVGRRDTRHPIIIGSIQSVAKQARQIGWIDLLSVDECFAAGTMVETKYGLRPIENIRKGEIVRNATGYGVVQSTSHKSSQDIVSVRLTNGSIIRCTANHPFFTDRGWVKAGWLERNTPVFSSKDVSALRDTVLAQEECQRKYLGQDSLLLDLLLKESKQSDDGFGDEGEDERFTSSYRSQADDARGEWSGYDQNAGARERMAWRRVEGRARNPNSSEKINWSISACVQSGFSSYEITRRGGTRWTDTLWDTRFSGSEKGRAFNVSRVESISFEECRRNEDVFNLQVGGHPSFYAGGVLVHNCHLIPVKGTSQYQSFITELRAINPDMKLVGLSGTPFRLTTGYLHTGPSAMFDSMCFEIGIPELIERGFLVPPISLNMETQFNVSGVKTTGGDYAAGELEAAVNVDASTRAAVAEMVAVGRMQNRRKWIAFCAGIKHSKAVRDEVRRHGITCEDLDGTTSKTERANMLAAYAAGRIQCLTNVNVLSIGFDDPGIDLLALMRPTKSVGLYIQQCGRGLRCLGINYEESCARGKTSCIILDYCDLVRNLGPIDQPIIKDERKKKPGGGLAPVKVCVECRSYNAASARECSTCGEPFPVHHKDPVQPTASLLPILSTGETPTPSKGQEPSIHDWIPVDSAVMSLHRKFGDSEATPTGKVTYRCGRRVFSEWICPFHPTGSGPYDKTVRWWASHGITQLMPTLKQIQLGGAIDFGHAFEAIKVKKEGSFDRIFAFKMRKPEDIQAIVSRPRSEQDQMLDEHADEDIPF